MLAELENMADVKKFEPSQWVSIVL